MSDLNTEEEENQNFSSLIMKKLENREEFIKLKVSYGPNLQFLFSDDRAAMRTAAYRNYFLIFQAKLRAQIALALEDTSTPSSPDETATLKTNDDLQLTLDLINECLLTLNLKYTSSVFLSETAHLTIGEQKFQTRPELLKSFGLTDVESDIPVLMKILPKPVRTEETAQPEVGEQILKE
jgi:hypothetical protein